MTDVSDVVPADPAPERADPPPEVTARPLRWGRYGDLLGLFVFAVFVVIAFVMKRDNAGAWFDDADQWFTAVIGLILGGFLHLLGRPRRRADGEAVRLRGYIGTWRTIPWDMIVAVEFKKSARFARVRLPGDEILVIYAIQRADREDAVAAMRALRAQFAHAHPQGVRPR